MTILGALTDGERVRLAKLAGMLGSEHDGERASAALLATKLLREKGLTWRDALDPAPKVVVREVTVPQRYRYPRSAWRTLVAKIEASSGYWSLLSEWERSFIDDLGERRRPDLSDKQHRVLERIAVWLWHNGEIEP